MTSDNTEPSQPEETSISASSNESNYSRITRKVALYAVGVFIALHGLAHLIGTMVYFDPTGELYRTTILWGAIDLGDVGIRVWGGLYAVSTAAFAISAAGMILDRQWWRRLLLSVLLVSLLITFADLDRAYVGFIINIALLIGLAAHIKARWFDKDAQNR